MNINFRQLNLPAKILALIPLSFFFPVGVMYTCIIVFLIAWLYEGSFIKKFHNVQCSSTFIPIVFLVVWISFELIVFSLDNSRRFLSVIHYFILLFLLVFLSMGGGAWQLQAKKIFFMGALYGTTIYYLTHLAVMPDWRIFANYAKYGGNKSIALGIFLAIASAWILDEVIKQTNLRRKFLYFLAYIYIASAILFFAMTRTGILLLLVLSSAVVIRYFRFNFRSLLLALLALTIIYGGWYASPVARGRADVTVQAVQNFYAGQVGTGQGNRLQFVKITGEMIMEKPLLGHGVGSWLQQYPERAKGLETSTMSTPHSDYLLYTAELGLIGLILLLVVYISLLHRAWKIGFDKGIGLFLVTVTMMVGGLFNAILRDWKFGMPMMILLAVAYVRDAEGKPPVTQSHTVQSTA